MNDERRIAQLEMELKLTTARQEVKRLEADKLAMKASWIAEDLEELKAQHAVSEELPIKEAKEEIQEAPKATENIEYRSADRVPVPAAPVVPIKAAPVAPEIHAKPETPAETRARAEAAMLAMLQHSVPVVSEVAKEEAVKEAVKEVKHCESHEYIAAALERKPSIKNDDYKEAEYDITLTAEELKYNREHKAEARAAKAALERKPARNTVVEQVIAEPEPVVKEDKNPFRNNPVEPVSKNPFRKPVESAESKNPFKNFRFCTACAG